MSARRISLFGLLAVAALLALAIGPTALAQKAAAASVTPRDGVPGTLFFPDGRGADTVRLSFSLVDEAQIDDGIERLGSLVTS